MALLALSSRSAFLAAAAALAALSAGVGAAGAQMTATPADVKPVSADPVSAAVAEASRRFGVPERWIWSVMRVESAGRTRAVSHAGAMGLMQVMPQTYAELRARYGLGPNPFDVRDNVLAGTAYLREMHDRYGVQGMLAAYNAGPARWEAYVRRGRQLPSETVGYLARLSPMVGAAAVSTSTGTAQPVAADARRPTLFVRVGDRSTTVGVQPERSSLVPSTTADATVELQRESVFVRRLEGDRAILDDWAGSANGSSADPLPASANPLFVPVRLSSEGT